MQQIAWPNDQTNFCPHTHTQRQQQQHQTWVLKTQHAFKTLQNGLRPPADSETLEQLNSPPNRILTLTKPNMIFT